MDVYATACNAVTAIYMTSVQQYSIHNLYEHGYIFICCMDTFKKESQDISERHYGLLCSVGPLPVGCISTGPLLRCRSSEVRGFAHTILKGITSIHGGSFWNSSWTSLDLFFLFSSGFSAACVRVRCVVGKLKLAKKSKAPHLVLIPLGTYVALWFQYNLVSFLHDLACILWLHHLRTARFCHPVYWVYCF